MSAPDLTPAALRALAADLLDYDASRDDSIAWHPTIDRASDTLRAIAARDEAASRATTPQPDADAVVVAKREFLEMVERWTVSLTSGGSLAQPATFAFLLERVIAAAEARGRASAVDHARDIARAMLDDGYRMAADTVAENVAVTGQLEACRRIRRYTAFALTGDENADVQLAADRITARVRELEGLVREVAELLERRSAEPAQGASVMVDADLARALDRARRGATGAEAVA